MLCRSTLGAMARMDEQAGPGELRATLQVASGELRPACDVGLGRAGVAVARQVDENEAPAEAEEVQEPRAPRRVGGARQGLAAGQRVQQARLDRKSTRLNSSH